MVLKVKNETNKHGWHSLKQKMTVIHEMKTLMRTRNLIEGGSMAEWLGCQTCKSLVTALSSALATT